MRPLSIDWRFPVTACCIAAFFTLISSGLKVAAYSGGAGSGGSKSSYTPSVHSKGSGYQALSDVKVPQIAQHQQPQVNSHQNYYQSNTYYKGYSRIPQGYAAQQMLVEEEEVDERPRIRLNFGVHVPAMRIQLPRFHLPKITIRAKIRQPEAPPTISLPELNFDTSSKVSPPASNQFSVESQQRNKYPLPAKTGSYNYADSENTDNQQTFSVASEPGDGENSFTLSSGAGDAPKASVINHYDAGYATANPNARKPLPPSMHAPRYNYQVAATNLRPYHSSHHREMARQPSSPNPNRAFNNGYRNFNNLQHQHLLPNFRTPLQSTSQISYDDSINEGW